MKKTFTRRLTRYGVFLALTSITLLFIFIPQKYIEECKTGISLWAACVLPATFPFLFLTALFTKLGYVERIAKLLSPCTKKIFRLPGISGYVFLMSLLSGYPVGAKIVCDLTEGGAITKEEGARMSVIASSSGPLFLIGSVGNNMFHSQAVGFTLLSSHYLAVFLTGVFFGLFYRPIDEKQKIAIRTKEDNALYASMYSSVLSILCIGGFIAVFYVLSSMACDLKLYFPVAYLFDRFPLLRGTGESVFRGLIEMTSGCVGLKSASSPLAVPLCAFLITLGGASILIQQIGYLKKAGIRIKPFLLAKIIQATLAFFLCIALNAFV